MPEIKMDSWFENMFSNFQRVEAKRGEKRFSAVAASAVVHYRVFDAEAIKLLHHDQLFNIAVELVLCVGRSRLNIVPLKRNGFSLGYIS